MSKMANGSADDDLEMLELLKINEKLKATLEQRELMLFEMKKSLLKQPTTFKSIRSDIINKETALLGNIKHKSKKVQMSHMLAVYLRFVGIVVKEYSPDSCVVMFDISLNGESVAQYAVRISKPSDSDQWKLDTYNLPFGFCLDEITENHEIMTKDYFRTMHKALTAHHNRIKQINDLKEVLPSNVQILYSTNGSLVELIMQIAVKNDNEDDVMKVSLRLQYHASESLPKDLTITRLGVSCSEDMKKLKIQSEPFLVDDLVSAFKATFQNENNEYYISDFNHGSGGFDFQNGATNQNWINNSENEVYYEEENPSNHRQIPKERALINHNERVNTRSTETQFNRQSETQSYDRKRSIFQPAVSEASHRTTMSTYKTFFRDTGKGKYNPDEDEDIIKKYKKPSKKETVVKNMKAGNRSRKSDSNDEDVNSPKVKKNIKKNAQANNRKNKSKNNISSAQNASVDRSTTNKRATKKANTITKSKVKK